MLTVSSPMLFNKIGGMMVVLEDVATRRKEALAQEGERFRQTFEGIAKENSWETMVIIDSRSNLHEVSVASQRNGRGQ